MTPKTLLHALDFSHRRRRDHCRARLRGMAVRHGAIEHLESRTLLATIMVTSASDRAFASDNDLTLRDAIRLVNGNLTMDQLSAAQRSLVDGTPDQIGVNDT